MTRLAGDVHPGRGQQGQGGGGALQAEGVAGGGAHRLGGQTLSWKITMVFRMLRGVTCDLT